MASPLIIFDTDAFIESVLRWLKNHDGSTGGAWQHAAELVFSLTPDSASSERVISLLKSMLGDKQDASVADLIQSSIMIHYN